MKKVVVVVIIFTLISCGLFFFFIDEEKTKEEFQNVSIQDSAVQRLYQMIHPTSYYPFYMDGYKKGTFSNEFILGTSLYAYVMEHQGVDFVSEEDLNVEIHRIFGSITYAHDSGYLMNQNLCAFRYHKVEHRYTFNTGCVYPETYTLKNELIQAKKSETEYFLQEKIILIVSNIEEVKNTNQEEVTIRIYGDVFERKLLDEFTYLYQKEEAPQIALEDYYDDASVYEYHFLFDGNSFVYKGLQKI